MEYMPVRETTETMLRAVALVGTTTVVLGFGLQGGAGQRSGLLGVAIERTQLADGSTTWLRDGSQA